MQNRFLPIQVEFDRAELCKSLSAAIASDCPTVDVYGIATTEHPDTDGEIIDQATMRQRGFRTVTEAAQGMTGVTGGDHPAEPSAFSLRGFTNSQINILYDGIKIGPQNMTSRVMDTGNLERIEILKGPASLMSGEGAAGGAIGFAAQVRIAELRAGRRRAASSRSNPWWRQ